MYKDSHMATSQRSEPRFHVNDYVYFSSVPGRGAGMTSERFIVVSVMPRDRAGAFQYRIKPIESGPHRVVTELELRR